MKLSVLMPVYNEERTLEEIVKRVLAQRISGIQTLELVIVDDCSRDRSREIMRELAARHPEIVAVFQEKNGGKGSAIRAAIARATGDIALVQDADLEYDPRDYPALLRPILDGDADVVYGTRFQTHGARRVLYFKHALGNKLLTFLSNLFTDLYLTDMETCYKVFRMSVLKTIPIRSKCFGIEPEITAKIAKRGLRVYEVPISYRGRTYAEGKKIGWRDGVHALWVMFKYWLIDDAFEEDYGHEILREMSEAPKFVDWTVDLVRPYLGRQVLEVGSGIGNNVRRLACYADVVATEVNDKYLSVLANEYEGMSGVSVRPWDVTQCPPEGMPSVDTVYCSNVLEHIQNEGTAVRNMASVMHPNGRLILVVPRGTSLFSSLDESAGHERRYDWHSLAESLARNGLTVEKIFTFNKVAVIGWWLRGKVLRCKTLGRASMKLFNSLVPMLRLVDRLLPWQGLSLVAIARKDPDPMMQEVSLAAVCEG